MVGVIPLVVVYPNPVTSKTFQNHKPKQPPRNASPNHSACLQIVRRQCTERRGGKGQAWDLETAMQNIGLQRTSGSTKNHALHGRTLNR